MLGLSVALLPREPANRPDGRPLASSTALAAAGVVAAAVIALGLLSPWLAARDVNNAAKTWPTRVAGAFDDLRTAAELNPLSPTPQLVRASIAQRVGLNAAAENDFKDALDRDPGNTYAVLELGAMAAQAGRRAEAERYLARLRELNPRDEFAPIVLGRMRSGKPLPVSALNAMLLQTARVKIMP
jgi:tetratricopeptide (TPR) repeat protein